MSKRFLAANTVPISALPSTPVKTELMSYVSDLNTVVTVVAAEELGTLSLYVGYPHINSIREELKRSPNALYNCTRIVTPTEVMSLGNMLDVSYAASLFPGVRLQ